MDLNNRRPVKGKSPGIEAENVNGPSGSPRQKSSTREFFPETRCSQSPSQATTAESQLPLQICRRSRLIRGAFPPCVGYKSEIHASWLSPHVAKKGKHRNPRQNFWVKYASRATLLGLGPNPLPRVSVSHLSPGQTPAPAFRFPNCPA